MCTRCQREWGQNLCTGEDSMFPASCPSFRASQSSSSSTVNPLPTLALLASVLLLSIAVPMSAQVPRSTHVVLVIEENTGFNTTTANMPWLVGQGNANGFANNYTTNSGG